MNNFTPQYIPYKRTKAFSAIVQDYIDGAKPLAGLYRHPVDMEGIRASIAERKNFPTDRTLLVAELKKQYAALPVSEKVAANIDRLLHENTFTICTAHQPNIFTGHLYFIYKILHAIKLAEELKQEMPSNDFVPVYYMGSEDADLEELGEVNINGKKYEWKTSQKGAVGRMKIDKAFIALLDEISGQLSVEPFGKEIMGTARTIYAPGKTIGQATFEFVHVLLEGYGLLVLLPDNPALKNAFAPVIKKELEQQFSNKAVQETIKKIPAEYKIQAAGREINLFYLKDDSRERLEEKNNGFAVANTTTTFSINEMQDELAAHPERFSPNVILRPVFQEMILPDIAFIGGGGELAYWLELKDVFNAVHVPFPVLVLRNSFMIVPAKTNKKIAALEMKQAGFFEDTETIIKKLVAKESSLRLELNEEKASLKILYDTISNVATAVDSTLKQHVASLQIQAEKKLAVLEKKMLKAEMKRFAASERQVEKIKTALFPNGNLQERVDNLLPYYSLYGKGFIDQLYRNSAGLKQEFCILTEEG